MAISSFNSIAGFSVGESNTLVIDTNGNISSNIGTFTDANISNTVTTGNITATGTITANYLFSTGNITGAGIVTAGESSVGNIWASGLVTGSNITANNTITSTRANISGNASVGNLTVTGNITSNPIYGSFWSNTTQTTANANIVQLFTLNNTDGHNSIILGNGASNSQMIINRPGVYNIQFSAQILKTSTSLDSVYIWLRQNGQDIANTAGYFQVDRDTASIQSWNFIVSTANIGEYVELAFATTDTTISFPAIAAQSSPYVRPEIPSIIATIVPVGA